MRTKTSLLIFSLFGLCLLVGALWLLKETRLIQMVLDNFLSNLVTDGIVETSDGEGGMIVGTFVDWRPIKQLFLAFSFFLVFAVTLICYFIYRYVSRKKIARIAEGIQLFFSQSEASSTGSLAIDHELLKIKDTMNRNEALLKEETQRTKDLITYLAHDLKTPLASVIGYLNLLLDTKNLTNEQMTQSLTIALEKSERLETLMNEFFDITRFNLQDIQLYQRELDFVFLLKQIQEEFYPLLKEKEQTICYSGPESLKLKADSEQLARVLNNLLKNAIAYAPDQTTITMQLTVDEQAATFILANQSEPIEQAQLEALFEKFYRLDQARSTKTGGAGLGLAIAKEIILAHQGTIRAASKNNEIQMIVTLPLATNQHEKTRKSVN
ncbi:HAMP domain-containing sensor histidine kinase [Enterococcus casseliflavus]|uniref:sensor histidine kinase n=1 Tax=Enterococcus casseliflavus TaxID=37734 RepID=UPI002DB58031|nr:HAMP domain-containing sensor histidine kinase [Enterococcus casseliflavus]MEB8401348.1 HAMP domain-containing histidine kinase [Enterococcus casseliflavus]